MRTVARLIRRAGIGADRGIALRVREYALAFVLLVVLASTRTIGSTEDVDAARAVAVASYERTVDLVRAEGLELTEVDDVRAAVVDGDADAGLVIDDDRAVIIEATREASSRNASQRLRLALLSQDRPMLTDFPVQVVDDHGREHRLAIATALVLALTFGVQGAAATAARELSGTADAGTLESLVVLPIRRWALAAGIAVGLGWGVVTDLAIFAVLAGGIVMLPLPGLGLDGAAADDLALGLVLATIALAPLVASLSVATAAGRRGSSSTAVVTALQLPLLVGGIVVSQQVRRTSSALRYVPGVSSLRAAGDAVIGRLDVAGVLSAIGTTVLGTLAFLGCAAWLLGREGVGRRA